MNVWEMYAFLADLKSQLVREAGSTKKSHNGKVQKCAKTNKPMPEDSLGTNQIETRIRMPTAARARARQDRGTWKRLRKSQKMHLESTLLMSFCRFLAGSGCPGASQPAAAPTTLLNRGGEGLQRVRPSAT